MEEPDIILKPGTKIIVHPKLGGTTGIFVQKRYLDARKPGSKATLASCVGGHGGDIYWAVNEDGSKTAYGWHEFELDPAGQPAAPPDPRADEFEAKATCPMDEDITFIVSTTNGFIDIEERGRYGKDALSVITPTTGRWLIDMLTKAVEKAEKHSRWTESS